MDDFISPRENYPREAVELLEADRRWRVERHDAHDARLHLGCGAEVVLADLHDMIDLSVQLHVRGEAGPEVGAGGRDEAEGELALKHEDGNAEERAVGEESEDEGRRDLVWRVGDADVKVGQFSLDKVADHNVELALLRSKDR